MAVVIWSTLIVVIATLRFCMTLETRWGKEWRFDRLYLMSFSMSLMLRVFCDLIYSLQLMLLPQVKSNMFADHCHGDLLWSLKILFEILEVLLYVSHRNLHPWETYICKRTNFKGLLHNWVSKFFDSSHVVKEYATFDVDFLVYFDVFACNFAESSWHGGMLKHKRGLTNKAIQHWSQANLRLAHTKNYFNSIIPLISYLWPWDVGVQHSSGTGVNERAYLFTKEPLFVRLFVFWLDNAINTITRTDSIYSS